MMTHRGRKRFLWSLNVTLLATLTAVAGTHFAMPVRVNMPDPDSKPSDDNTIRETQTIMPPLSVYVSAAQRDLRRPLFDPPPVPTQISRVPDKPRLALKLVGTAVEPGSTYGLFIDRSGKTKFAKVGEILDGAEITTINDGTATVLYHGETITLEVPEKGGGR